MKRYTLLLVDIDSDANIAVQMPEALSGDDVERVLATVIMFCANRGADVAAATVRASTMVLQDAGPVPAPIVLHGGNG